MAGRPRKPTALKLLHGDFEKDPQRQNKREPIAKAGRPTCPRHLKGEARKEWTRVTKELADLTVLAKTDRAALQHYCETWELRSIALADVQKNGCFYTTIDQGGNVIRKRNPADVAFLEYSRLCHKYLTEFGLTPSSRTRIQIEKEVESRSDMAAKYLA